MPISVCVNLRFSVGLSHMALGRNVPRVQVEDDEIGMLLVDLPRQPVHSHLAQTVSRIGKRALVDPLDTPHGATSEDELGTRLQELVLHERLEQDDDRVRVDLQEMVDLAQLDCVDSGPVAGDACIRDGHVNLGDAQVDYVSDGLSGIRGNGGVKLDHVQLASLTDRK